MNNYPNGPQQPYQQPPSEFRVPCQLGHIVITQNAVRLETNQFGRGEDQKSISRAQLTGVELKVYPKLLGMGGIHSDLIFYGQGTERIIAKIVRTDLARQIVAMLGY